MKGQSVVIKKVIKKGGAAAHGGSWKVAYADFVTAMMAFFLLMWLINMTSPEKKMQLSTFFQSVSVFDMMSQSFLGKGEDVLDTNVVNSDTGTTDLKGKSSVKPDVELYRESMDESEDRNPNAKGLYEMVKKEYFTEKIKKEIEEKLQDVKEHVLVDVIERGVRVQLIDTAGKPMFPIGSSELTPDAERILQVIGENIKTLSNVKASIEGHTDSLNYATNKYTNWELSTDRASSARMFLEQNGLNPDNISKVAGYAATQPLIKEDPKDPRNRRISILLEGEGLAPRAEESVPAETGGTQAASKPHPKPQAKKDTSKDALSDPTKALPF